MKVISIQGDTQSFKASEKIYQMKGHKFVETWDGNKLTHKIEYDEFGRDVDSKGFNKEGLVTYHMHKDYYEKDDEKGYIEHYKDAIHEYIRKAYTKFVSGMKHVVDDYTSVSHPDNSYIVEFIHDPKGKLIKVLTNGK